MHQNFHILTLTHRQSDLKDIGRLVAAFAPQGELALALNGLKGRLEIDELVYLATCNRVMLIFTTAKSVDASFRSNLLPTESGCSELLPAMQHYQGAAAIEHLFAVAASVDSLVIGERQILGQLREAYENCRNWGLTGDDLRIVFDRAVLAGKDVYANTKIGEKSVSIVSLAVRKMLAKAPQKDAKILLVGAGQTNALVGKFLRKYGYEDVCVFNRSIERATQLAAGFANGQAYTLDQLTEYQRGFDVMFVCTAATDPIIHEGNFESLLAGASAEQKLVIDLSVPNNVAEKVVQTFNFHYVSVEHLRQLAEENLGFRSQEIQRARQLLAAHQEELVLSYRQRLLERAMHRLPTEIKAVRRKAIDQVFAKELEQLDPEARALMERMLTYMEKKCIGIPMKAAREALID